MLTRAKLRKSERLSREHLIASLFESGHSFLSPPFVIYYQITALPEPVPVQMLASVSKKRYRKAPDRNKIKRYIKEAYRTQKLPLYQQLQQNNKQLALSIVYIDKKITTFNDFELKIKVALSELCNKLNKLHAE